MLAISEYNSENHEFKDGSTYAWGRNGRCQLGLGNRDD
jgi:alpha-tubulin suppressor-like RCC1 family protein